MDIWYLATDFLCKKKVQEEINYYEQYSAVMTMAGVATATLLYNMYHYRKLKRNYEELKKKAGLDNSVKNVYKDLFDRTESSDESESDSESDDSEDERESEEKYEMEDIDLDN
jgi:hypothetical protein